MAKFIFNFTGATQTFAIPNGVSKGTIKVWGGGGGGQVNTSNSVAGAGGYSYGEIVFTPGQTLSIVVAKGGAFSNSATNSSAFQGGGIGGLGAAGSGGGGMSSVAFQGQNAFIIAGGGGGCGIGNISANLYFGGNGGGDAGNDTFQVNLSPPSTTVAKGGTQSAGGAGGSYSGAATAGFAGASLRGGRGGPEGSGLNGGGGGGGGGFFGGGGGAGTNEFGTGAQQEMPGAGGSGFIDTAVLQNAFTQAAARVTTKTVALPPNTSDPDYVTGIGVGPITNVAGGNGLVVIEFPSLSITKTADKSFAAVGDVITYTISTQNNPATISNVIFIDTIPSNTSFNPDSLFVDGVNFPGANPNPPGVNIGTVGFSNTTITFSVTVTTLPSPNRVSNIASISATSLEVVNSNTAVTTIVSAILNSTKQVSKTFANIGDILTYTIPITNTGNITASNILFIDTIPNGTTIIANSLRQDGVAVSGSSNPPGATLPNSLGVNRTTTVTFQVLITTVPSPNPIPNTASAIGTYIVDSTTIPNRLGTASTNTNTVNTAVNFASLGGINKLVDKNFATCGEVITYTIVVPNLGNVTALNVIFKDTIPNGTSLVSNSVFVNGVLQTNAFPESGVTIPNIGPGQTATLTFSVLVQC